MHLVYVADARAGPVTQNRFGHALASMKQETKNIEVLFFPHHSVTAILDKVKAADCVVVTVQATKIKALNNGLRGLGLKHVWIYMEDTNNPLVWHACRFASAYLGTSLFGTEPDVRKAICSVYPRVGAKPFHLLAHFGWPSMNEIPFDAKSSRIVFPSAFFTKGYSALRMQVRDDILGSDLKNQVDFLDATKGLKGPEFIRYLGKYKAVLVVVPGVSPLESFVIRKVFEVTSVGSLLLMHFGDNSPLENSTKDNNTKSYAKNAMTAMGFVDGVHYLDVTNSLIREPPPLDCDACQAVATRGHQLLLKHHMAPNRVTNFLELLK